MAECAGGAVILAAGFSRRFGSDKRTHRLNAHDTLLTATLRRYARCFERLVLVVRPGDEALAAAATAAAGAVPTQIVYCAAARFGMGHSLAAGATAATDWNYLFLALGDMPWILEETLGELRGHAERAPRDAIIQPTCGGRPGHPVGFGAAHLPALQRLDGDAGARRIVEQAGGRVQRIEFPDPGVLTDLDTPPVD